MMVESAKNRQHKVILSQERRISMARCFTLLSMSFGILFLTLNSQLSTFNSVHAASTDSIRLGITPRDIWPPVTISELSVVATVEGAVVLNWTAPVEDRDVTIPKPGPVQGYFLKYATFSVADVGGSTSTWWNDATFTSAFFGAQNPGFGESKGIAGLYPGVSFYFVIRSSDNAGLHSALSPTTTRQTIDNPPAEVAGVTALAGDVQVSLTWTDLTLAQKTTDFDFYRVYRATNSSFVSQVISTQTALTVFIDTNVVNGTTYYYRLVGVDKGIISTPAFVGDALESLSWSTVSARPMPPLPFAPSNLLGISATTSTITWQWQDNANNEDGFNVYAATGGLIVSVSSSPGVGGTTSFIEIGLTPGASYGILVKSFNLTGESTGSVTLTTFTLANPPANLTRSTATTASISLTWSNNNNTSGVRYILSQATWPLVSFTQIANTTSTVFISSGLAEDTTYTFRLKARNGENLESAEIELSTNTMDALPPAPINLTTLSVTESTITIAWSPPSPNPGDLDFYNIWMSSQTPAVWFATATVSVGITTYAVTGLSAQATYQFKVTVVDKGQPNFAGIAYESQDSNVISEKLKVTGPTALTVVDVTTESITWQWQDNSLVETGFRIYSSSGGVVGSTNAALGAGSTQQWLETGLIPGAQYSRYVKAVQNGEESDSSNSISKYALPNPPTQLTRSTATTSSASLNWNANNNASGVQYIIERATWPLLNFIQVGDVTATTFVSTGLAEFTTYTYRLKARNGDGMDSTTISIDTMTTKVPPAKITSLQASLGPFESSVLLQWIAPGDDGTSGNITAGLYDIRWSTENMQVSTSVYDTTPYQKLVSTNAIAGSQQGLLLTGLNFPNQTVFFALKTRDKVPNNFSELSNVVNSLVQVDITPPAKTNDLFAQLLGPTSAQLTWTAPGDDGNANQNSFGSYEIKYASFPLNDLATFQLPPPQVRSAADFGSIPSPAIPGTQQSMTLTSLALDTTYYFALRTRDEVPNFSELSNGATIFTPDLLAPGAVQNLKAVANTAVGKRIDLSWTNPTEKDLKGIRILVRTDNFTNLSNDTTAQKFDLTFSSPLTQPPTTFAHTGLSVGVTYYYSVFAFDDESPANFSAGAFASTSPVKTALPPPAKPKGVKGKRSGDGQSFAISWEPVTTRADGTAMEALELSSYTIYRLESVQGATNQVFVIGASTPSYIDTTLAGQELFYKVRAVNIGGTESEDSDIVSSDVSGTVFVMMDDGISFMAVPGDLKVWLDSNNLTLRGTRDLSQEGGVTFKAMNVDVMDTATGKPKKGFLFDQPIGVALGYQVDAAGNVANGAPLSQVFSQPLPKAEQATNAFSVYWYTGAQWVKLGTKVDSQKKTASVKSRQSGAYQLRLVQQALSSQMNAAYPRTITPNGDGINDVVFFLFENPTDAPVKGTIYDMKSAKVANAKLVNLFGDKTAVLSWDGSDESGAVVTAGIYLYRIEIGDKTFTGTVVVAR